MSDVHGLDLCGPAQSGQDEDWPHGGPVSPAERISIIIPVLNEEAEIGPCLLALQELRRRGHEVVVVDGGSRDGTVERALAGADKLRVSPPGRGVQMNLGARCARHDILLFLHVDTRLPRNADRLVQQALATRRWGYFALRLSGRSPLLRLAECGINWGRLLGRLPTGDQGLFVRRSLFVQAGSFAPVPLMEDLDLARRLRARSRPARIAQPLITSSRRWEEQGFWKTVFLMWRLRLAWWLGSDPRELVKAYYPGQDEDGTRA